MLDAVAHGPGVVKAVHEAPARALEIIELTVDDGGTIDVRDCTLYCAGSA